MYSVLIVDDEEPVLDSFAFMLDGKIPDFNLAGKARSGYEAIKLLYELKPDVVFMDIQMPGLDGLDTIEEVHEKFSETIFILSTAFERFDLACRAIPLGVHAFLVKPVTKQMFHETLTSVAELLDLRKKKQQQKIGSNKDEVLFQQYMSSEIWKEQSDEQWNYWRHTLSIDSNYGQVCLINLDSENKNRFNLLKEKLSKKNRFFFSEYLNFGLFLFPGDIPSSTLKLAISTALAETVSHEEACCVGFGPLEEGPRLYLSCIAALEDIRSKKSTIQDKISSRLKIIQIRRKIGLADARELHALFDSWWQEVFSFYSFSIGKAKMVSFFTLLVDDVCGCYQPQGEEEEPFDPAVEIFELADMNEWKDWSRSAFARLCNIAERRKTSALPIPLIKALSFIEGNFEKQIQLSDAAESASISSAYLSKLFASHIDSSFVDYLTRQRIEKAVSLMNTGGLSVKDIAFRTGYQDPNYFSKIFKKIMGVSPTKYLQGVSNE